MKRFIIFLGIISFFYYSAGTLSAQKKEDAGGEKSFSLQEAIDYAITNSPIIKNATLDLENAKKKIWETTAIGLPHVSGKFSYSYQMTLADKIKEFSSLTQLGSWMYGVDQALNHITPNQGFGHIPAPDPNQKTPSDNDLRWGSTLDLTVSQLIFSGAYIVGLQTSKVFKELSKLSISKSQNDLVENVSNAYYLVLIAQENKTIIDSIYVNTEKILNDMNALLSKGLIDETDPDQIKITLSTLKNSSDMLTRQVEVAKNLLKFQMGMDLKQNISLSDKLDRLLDNINSKGLPLKEFSVDNNADYKLLETQEKLAGLNLKFQKSTVLPDVAAFYSHQENFNENSFSFTPPNIIGISVNIPIFGSGMRWARIKQAKIGLEKASNTKNQVSMGLLVSFNEAKSAYLTAFNKYQVNKESVSLAEKIYKRTYIKYNKGVVSSLELTQSQNQLLQAQSNYYGAMMEFTAAANKLDKLLSENNGK